MILLWIYKKLKYYFYRHYFDLYEFPDNKNYEKLSRVTFIPVNADHWLYP